VIQRHLRLVPVSAVLLQSFLGFVLLVGGGCGGQESGATLTEQNKQNIEDELKSSAAAKQKGKVGQP
jgi:hypothetical protein